MQNIIGWAVARNIIKGYIPTMVVDKETAHSQKLMSLF
jgi:hypothetical protein